MSRIVENFKELSSKRRCSFDAEEAFLFLQEFCKKNGYVVKTDDAKNIVATKNSPSIYLQAHYDMVCLGETPPTIEIEGNILKAKNSTLGADNGIGIAYMMEQVRQQRDIGLIFTSDEEVGLLGARGLDIDFSGRYLINLDFESEGEICVGCAGGFDIKASLPLEYENKPISNTYNIKSSGFSGGHSGIEAGKKSAIKELVKLLYQDDLTLIDISGGEKINSIPKHASATVCTQGSIASTPHFGIKKIDSEKKLIKNSKNIIELLYLLHDGILEYDRELGGVQTSFNISLIYIENGRFYIEGMGRSNKKDEQLHLKAKTELLLQKFGFEDIEVFSYFEPWDVEKGELQNIGLEVFREFFENPKVSTIHAGLECGILAKYFKEVISIGPNIYAPHTKEEYAEIDSIEKTYNALEALIKRLC
ncbi:MAG: M20/M25/M40 family metallo-hydrolase [Campylobacterales bacterium]